MRVYEVIYLINFTISVYQINESFLYSRKFYKSILTDLFS